MTPQEQQLLDGLIERVEQTQLPEKDQEAEQRLRQTLGQNPDALYILCQTVLVQQYALEQAQKQLAEAKQQLAEATQPPPPQHTSFLGGLFGQAAAPPPPYSPVYRGQPGYAPVAPPQYVPASGGFGGGGFLQGALQTAAGVVAGEMAFRGIEDLMHGFGHEAGYGSDRELGVGGYDRAAVDSNYGDGQYGDERGGGFGDRLEAADGDQGMSSDIEDRRDSFVDSSSGDDGQNDDSGDFGGSEDGGGGDSGGDGGF